MRCLSKLPVKIYLHNARAAMGVSSAASGGAALSKGSYPTKPGAASPSVRAGVGGAGAQAAGENEDKRDEQGQHNQKGQDQSGRESAHPDNPNESGASEGDSLSSGVVKDPINPNNVQSGEGRDLHYVSQEPNNPNNPNISLASKVENRDSNHENNPNNPNNLVLSPGSSDRKVKAKGRRSAPASPKRDRERERVRSDADLARERDSVLEQALLCGVDEELEEHFEDVCGGSAHDINDRTAFTVTVYYPKQFHALRVKLCGGDYDFIQSLSRSNKWQATGGKSGAGFGRTRDGRYVLKYVSRDELRTFSKLGLKYFAHMARVLFKQVSSCMVKILGA